MTKERDETEKRLRELVDDEAYTTATDLALETYGDEIYNYIRKLAGDSVRADDAFQEFSVDLWNGWESFGWQSSVETWAYTIARNATYDIMRNRQRNAERPLRTDEQRELVARWTRTVTKNFEKTEAKHWLWEVVDDLDSEKRELLVLRIGHQKSWKEVARIMADDEPDDEQLRRDSARLRKKYQRVKDELRARRDEFDG